MVPDPATPLLRRVRWGNVARLAGAFAALALVLAWPRLRPHEPPLPPTGARPVERREREPARPKKRPARTAKRRERPARRKRSPVEAKRPQRPQRLQARHVVRNAPAPPPRPKPKPKPAPRRPSGGEFVFG